MPLTFAKPGEANVIKKVGGEREKQDCFLKKLGFVEGSVVTVVAENAGNLIVNIKDSRVAIDKDMASKILV